MNRQTRIRCGRKVDIVLPSLGFIGAQLYVVNLSRRLEALGNDCSFILLAKVGELLHEAPAAKIFNCEPVVFSRIRIVRVLESLLRLLLLLRRRKCDVILTVTPFLNRVVCLFKLLRLIDQRVVIESHQYPPVEVESGYNRFWRLFYSNTYFLYKSADIHRTPSSGIDSFFTSMGHKNTHRAPNLIDLDRIRNLAREAPGVSASKRPYNVVSLGRLTNQKNLGFLLQSFAKAAERIDAHLWVIGEGDQQRRLSDIAIMLGVQDRVTFTGMLRNPYPLLRQADAFVLTSVWEGLPQTILEAMILEVPVVAVDCPTGPSDMIGSSCERGWLGATHDVEDFASTLGEALTSADKQAKLHAAAKFASTHYDIDKNVRDYDAIFLGPARP